MTDFNLAQPLPQLDKCVELLQNAIEKWHSCRYRRRHDHCPKTF